MMNKDIEMNELATTNEVEVVVDGKTYAFKLGQPDVVVAKSFCDIQWGNPVEAFEFYSTVCAMACGQMNMSQLLRLTECEYSQVIGTPVCDDTVYGIEISIEEAGVVFDLMKEILIINLPEDEIELYARLMKKVKGVI
jgi:hypothetical protein